MARIVMRPPSTTNGFCHFSSVWRVAATAQKCLCHKIFPIRWVGEMVNRGCNIEARGLRPEVQAALDGNGLNIGSAAGYRPQLPEGQKSTMARDEAHCWKFYVLAAEGAKCCPEGHSIV